MPPTNISFATAVDLGALPADVTQTDINDAGVNYTVYYKFTAPVGANEIGAWGFSSNVGGAVYRPSIRPYLGPAGAPTQILSIQAQNIPIEFPVTAGQEYFLEFIKNLNDAGPNSLRVRVEVAPLETVITGDIFVNDDNEGFPAAVVSGSVDYESRRFYHDVAASDDGAILYRSSRFLIYDAGADTYKLYDYNFTLLDTFVGFGFSGNHVSANEGSDKFYIGNAGAPVTYKTVINGVLSAAVEINAGTGMTCLAANNDDTILYWSGLSTSVNTPVKRWDIVNGVALADFVAAEPDYQNEDIIVLEDDTILISYYKDSLPRDFYVRRYDADGTLLDTYNFGSDIAGIDPKITRALDSPDSFWAWVQHAVSGERISTFSNVRISDGVVISSVDHVNYTSGVYDGSETVTPSARFGVSTSCFFSIMEAPTPSGIYFVETEPVERHDIYYDQERKIPDPTIRTALIGE